MLEIVALILAFAGLISAIVGRQHAADLPDGKWLTVVERVLMGIFIVVFCLLLIVSVLRMLTAPT